MLQHIQCVPHPPVSRSGQRLSVPPDGLVSKLRYAETMNGNIRLQRAGFTLVELLVAMLIVAVLATLAYPSYIDSVRRSRRQDAISALKQVQLAQERWRANHPEYGTLTELGLPATTEGGYYSIAVILPSSPDDQTQYRATATAAAGKSQAQDKARGVSCAVLEVNQDQAVYTPVAQSACWGK